jgi:hypothetical protein
MSCSIRSPRDPAETRIADHRRQRAGTANPTLEDHGASQSKRVPTFCVDPVCSDKLIHWP